MGKTYRNTDRYSDFFNHNESKYASRLKRRQDGSIRNEFCGSAKDGVLDNFDDIGSGGKAKRYANKQIRKYNKNYVKSLIEGDIDYD